MMRAKSVAILVAAVAMYKPLRLTQYPVVMEASHPRAIGLQAKIRAKIIAMLYPHTIAEMICRVHT